MRFAVVTTTMAALALAGCADPKVASKDNFKQAINAYWAKNPLCIDAPDGSFRPVDAKPDDPAFPAYSPAISSAKNAYERQTAMNFAYTLFPLSQAGLLKVTTKQMKGTYSGSPTTAMVDEYTLTDAGKAAFKDTGKRIGNVSSSAHRTGKFCYGTPEVVDIVRYTEPSSAMGQTVSEVSYTYRLKDRPKWSENSALLAKEPLMAAQSGNTDARDIVVLTNEGWRDARDR